MAKDDVKEKVKKEKPRSIKLDRVGAKLATMYDGKNYDKKTMTILTRDALLCIRDVLIKEAGKSGEATLAINGFGSFKLVIKKARKARNPKTGESIDVPEKTALKITISSAIKRKIAEAGFEAASKNGKTKSKKTAKK